MKPQRPPSSFAILLMACSVIATVARLSRIGVGTSANYSPHGTRIAFNSDGGGTLQVWTVAGRDALALFNPATLRSTPGPSLPAVTAGRLKFSGHGRLLATLGKLG